MSMRRPCDQCGENKYGGVQYRLTTEDYDGVSEWRCEKCGARYGRWTGKRLAEGELERRYGRSPEITYMPHETGTK